MTTLILGEPTAINHARQKFNRTHYLRTRSTAELAEIAGELMSECLSRGIQVAGLMGAAVGRIEGAVGREVRG